MEESIIEKIMQEYNELKQYKSDYEYQEKDKEKMANAIYEYELKDYKKTTVEERKNRYIKETCKDCRWFRGKEEVCTFQDKKPEELLSEDILMPIKTEENYFPAHKGCKCFMWD